jgi:hypothetical protein
LGVKFHVGPEIVSNAGKQEGAKRKEDSEKQPIYVNAQRKVPTARKSKWVEMRSQGEPDLEKRIEETQMRTTANDDREQSLPKEDLALKRVDDTLTGPVKETEVSGPHYKNRAPVEIGLDIEKLVEAVLKTELNIPLKDLAGISTIVQKEIRRQMTKTKVPIEEKAIVGVQGVEVIEAEVRLEDQPMPMFLVTQTKDGEVPEGCCVAQDPVLQYLADNPTVKAGNLVVSQASEPLRAIYGSINEMLQEESLLDNGSMIISMSKTAAVENGLNWDPGI